MCIWTESSQQAKTMLSDNILKCRFIGVKKPQIRSQSFTSYNIYLVFCFCLFVFLFVFSNRCLAGLLKGDPLYRHKTLCSHSLTTV